MPKSKKKIRRTGVPRGFGGALKNLFSRYETPEALLAAVRRIVETHGSGAPTKQVPAPDATSMTAEAIRELWRVLRSRYG